MRERSGHEEFMRRLVRALGVAALLVFAYLVVFYGGHVLLVGFAGSLLALYFRGLGAFLGRWIPVPTRLLVGFVLLAHVGLAVLFAWYAVPLLEAQGKELAEQLPAAVDKLRSFLGDHAWGRPVLGALPDSSSLSLSAFRDMGLFSSTFSFLVDVVVILIVGVYGALEPGLYRRGFLLLFPPRLRAQAASTTDESVVTLRHFILGLFASATIIGLCSSVGLAILGVPLPVLMGLLAALLTFVPNIGPIVSVVPPALLALLQSPTLALWVLVLYGALQFLESYVITPLIQRRAVALPPALLVLAQVLLGVLAGPLGIAMAAPLTALGLVLTKKLYVEEPDVVPGQDDDEREEDDEDEDEPLPAS